MVKISKTYLVLSLIVVFAFLYRILLMLREGYPPSADLGLHNSVIYSITQGGNTNFLWNFYHMGAGISLTFPGYHIFVSYIMLLTGFPDCLVHALVASLFSSLIVLVSFLITQKVWSTSAALIVAFLVAFARFDIEMLMWGGYPNVVTLMLIPLTFYIFLQQAKFSLPNYLVLTSLISGSILLTHSLSAAIFVTIVFITVIIALVFAKRFDMKRTQPILWILPIIIGAIIISPFIMQAIPTFLNANQGGLFGDAVDVRLATISTQSVAIDFIFPLIFYVILIFIFLRKSTGKFFSISAFLLSLWILIPAIGSQSHLIGFYTDYNRFRYFVYLPVIILFGVVFDYTSGFFAKAIDIKLFKMASSSNHRGIIHKLLSFMRPALSHKPLYVLFVIVLLIYSLFSSSLFLEPSKGIEMQSFYQIMDDPSYEAMEWIKNYTSPSSIIAADSVYGWWIPGFTQRQTLSGQEPQYLIVSREYEPAKNVRYLLDTNFLLDNGLIQVREDGGHIGRYNPLFLAKIENSYFPYKIFHFNTEEIMVQYRINNELYNFSISELSLTDMYLEQNNQSATIVIARTNSFFTILQTTTVYQGVRFANMTFTIEPTHQGISIDWVKFYLDAKYAKYYEATNYFAFIDEQLNIGAQLIFTQNQPTINKLHGESSQPPHLQYTFNNNSTKKIEMFIGTFQIDPIKLEDETCTEYIYAILSNNVQSYHNSIAADPIDTFSYEKFLSEWNISYIVVRDPEVTYRFRNDPLFSLVFVNEEVAIFKVARTTR